MTVSPQPPSDSSNPRRSDVAGIMRRLAACDTVEDLLRESPVLSWDDLRACFADAAEMLSSTAPAPAKIETVEWTAENVAEPATVPPPAAEAATLPPEQAPIALLPTKRISLPGYEIVGKIGEGGMGVVYKARHLRLNRLVAIKMIRAGEHASDAMIARFAVEAEAVAQLQHPGIVQIHEIGEHDGHSFLALEYVAGGSLAARLDDEPWLADRAAELVETLARAMQAAHDRGIIHRDLKPENILLTEASVAEDGQLTPKITDFGLAKRLQETGGRTRTGEIMGTPSYMAPEQAAGNKNIGPAADVYALGAVLYRLITGRPPFQAETSLDTMMLVLEQEPAPPRSLNKSLPRDLETIALKCLAKKPAKRYASAAELADDLRRFLDGEPIKARRLSYRQRLFRWCRQRPGAAVARGTLAAALLVLAGLSFADGVIAGFEALTWILIALFSPIAVVRTRLRPFLNVFLASALLAIVAWELLRINYPALNSRDLAVLAFLFPLGMGLIGGLFTSFLGRILGRGLVLALLLAALRWPDGDVSYLLGIIVLGIYCGAICRFICWYTNGDLIDSIVGCVWGSLAGSGLGLMGIGLIFGSFREEFHSKSAGYPVAIAIVIMIVTQTVLTVIGSILGAYIGATSVKKASRRGHG